MAADVDEAVTGQRREGIFAGVMTLVRKVAQSGAIILTDADWRALETQRSSSGRLSKSARGGLTYRGITVYVGGHSEVLTAAQWATWGEGR